MLQPDTCWCGGLTQLRKIFALADARNVWVALSSPPPSSAGRARRAGRRRAGSTRAR
ncbi:MAG: hypothetical protein HY359_15950 [Candidatus Rokubacteria bacterium]|nr:hypothetical protein [Candidatus Rokubacteria bacterium]